jgi:gluconolactonase
MSKLPALPLSVLLITSCGTTGAPEPVTVPLPAAPPEPAAAPSPGTQTTPLAGELFPGVGAPSALRSDVSFESLEGPLWVPASGGAEGHLLFSDVVEANAQGARIYSFDPRAARFSVVPYPPAPSFPATSTNGLAIDAAGNLLACERYNARVIRLAPGGRLSVLADHFPTGSEGAGSPGGLPLNAPNDLAVRRDGNVYFTDSDWGARPGSARARMAVYRVSPRGDLDRAIELEKPNGIALSPDQSTLYVGSDVQAKVWRLPLDAAGVPGAPSLLIDGARVPGGFKVPDGICVDDAGNLYVTNNADDVKAIVVFDPAGRSLGRIPFPQRPSNCTFGGEDRRTMYVTTLHAVYKVRMPTPGLP